MINEVTLSQEEKTDKSDFETYKLADPLRSSFNHSIEDIQNINMKVETKFQKLTDQTDQSQLMKEISRNKDSLIWPQGKNTFEVKKDRDDLSPIKEALKPW